LVLVQDQDPILKVIEMGQREMTQNFLLFPKAQRPVEKDMKRNMQRNSVP